MSGNNKPIVLFLNHWAKQLGGAEHSLLDMLYFAGRRFTCHLITSEPGPLLERAEQMNVKCHVIPCVSSLENVRRWNFLRTLLLSWPDIIAFIAYVFRLRRVLFQIKPNLIHANVPKSHIALFMLSRIGYAGKCCFHIREIFNNRTMPAFIYKILFPRKNSAVIAISNAVKQNLPHNIISQATIIYNGVSLPHTPKKYGTVSTLKLLYLGRVVPWKGCHILLDMLSMVIKQYPSSKVELSLVGDTLYWPDTYRNELKDKIEYLHLSSCCYLLPHTSDTESVFLTHDIFCNASQKEPFGRVIAEAQGCGLPVIAFKTGGIPEIVIDNETGILVPYGNCNLFTDAIGRFIERPDLIERMGSHGRERVKNHFNRNNQGPLISQFLYEHLPPKTEQLQ